MNEFVQRSRVGGKVDVCSVSLKKNFAAHLLPAFVGPNQKAINFPPYLGRQKWQSLTLGRLMHPQSPSATPGSCYGVNDPD